MPETTAEYPTWVIAQRGRRYRSGDQAGFMNRHKIVRQYAMERAAVGNPATAAEIKDMLRFLDRGYALNDDQISAALAASYRAGTVPKQPRGRAVVIDGTDYLSARAASEAIGVSHQTVRRRVTSDAPEWREWRER